MLSYWRRIHPLDSAAAMGFLAYAATSTITPICLVILAREMQFTLAAAGWLEVARSGLAIVIMLASGFLAGRFGKVRSLGWAGLTLGAGMLVYALAPGYGVVVLALAILGLGAGVMDALVNPLICELHPQDSGRYLNFINAFWSVGVLATMLITGDLLSREVSWRLLAAAAGVVALFSGYLFFRRQNTKPRDDNLRLRQVWSHKREVLRQRGFWLFFFALFLGGAAEGGFTFWSASLIQLEYGGSPRAGGAGVAFFACGMIVARIGWAVVIPQARLWHLLAGSCLLGLPVSLAVPLAGSLAAAFALLFLAGVASAALWPSIQSYAAERLPVDATALFILLSCGGIPGFAFSAWLMGWVGETYGLRASFWCLTPFYAGLLLLLVRERYSQRWRRQK